MDIWSARVTTPQLAVFRRELVKKEPSRWGFEIEAAAWKSRYWLYFPCTDISTHASPARHCLATVLHGTMSVRRTGRKVSSFRLHSLRRERFCPQVSCLSSEW